MASEGPKSSPQCLWEVLEETEVGTSQGCSMGGKETRMTSASLWIRKEGSL